MSPTSPIFRTSFEAAQQRERIQEACDWANVSRGRTVRYPQLLNEFEGWKRDSLKHWLAFHDSLDVCEIYELWRDEIDRFPGLKDKISETFQKGPLIQEEEDSKSSSNKARNNAFNYLLAGRFIASGIEVLAVDDILATGETSQWKGEVAPFVWTECSIP